MAIFNYSNEEPQFVTCDRHLGQKVYTINFNIEEIEDEEQYGQRYRYCSVTLPVGRYDRSAVISAIIRHRYDDDKMQAIINNYLDPTSYRDLYTIYLSNANWNYSTPRLLKLALTYQF